MAGLTRRVFKLVAVVGTIPAVGIALGYRARSLQASEANSSGVRRVYKVKELPIYSNFDYAKEDDAEKITYPRNSLEEQIGVVRKSVQGFFSQFSDVFETVISTFETGKEHSKSTLDYVQNSPGELPRIVFITVAGMGGVILGFRGGLFRKLTYASIAVVSSAALCYPQKSVELSQESYAYAKQLWKENVGEDFLEKYWPFRKDDQSEGLQESKQPTSNIEGKLKLKGDIGQSNPGDKDLYTTRSS